jgi:hypothetical protein
MWIYNPQTPVSLEPLPYAYSFQTSINPNKMQKEQWKPIKGYEDRYLISDHGRALVLPHSRPHPRYKNVLSRYGLKLLNPQSISAKYLQISLCGDGTKKKMYIHRLVIDAFILNPENKPECNHKDGNKLNNHASNLEWCTTSENAIHAFKTGLCVPHMLGKFGVNNHRSKAVYQIEDGKIIAEFGSQGEAHRKTGIEQANISCVCNGGRKTAGGFIWKHKSDI